MQLSWLTIFKPYLDVGGSVPVYSDPVLIYQMYKLTWLVGEQAFVIGIPIIWQWYKHGGDATLWRRAPPTVLESGNRIYNYIHVLPLLSILEKSEFILFNVSSTKYMYVLTFWIESEVVL